MCVGSLIAGISSSSRLPLDNEFATHRPARTVIPTSVLVREVLPKHTSDAFRAKTHGTVLLECVVKTNGSIDDVRVVRSIDSVFGSDPEAPTRCSTRSSAAVGARVATTAAVRNMANANNTAHAGPRNVRRASLISRVC